jgi:hypothetical protein
METTEQRGWVEKFLRPVGTGGLFQMRQLNEYVALQTRCSHTELKSSELQREAEKLGAKQVSRVRDGSKVFLWQAPNLTRRRRTKKSPVQLDLIP